MIDPKDLVKNGVHFGHQASRWCPKMKPYIWGQKNGVHLIDVYKTAFQLEQAAKFLEKIASEGKVILWVGTKKAAQLAISEASKKLNLPFVVHRWVGGTFSNYKQVRKSVANLLHYEDIIAKSETLHYNKKELSLFSKRIERLNKSIGGIRHLTWPIGAVVVVDVKKEHVCVKEANATGIPIVALVDTNCDPSTIDYVIPANDDAPRAVNYLIEYLSDAAARGLEVAKANKLQVVQDQAMALDITTEGDYTLEDEEDASENKSKAKVVKPVAKKPGSTVARVGGPRKTSFNGPRKPKSSDESNNDSRSSTKPNVSK